MAKASNSLQTTGGKPKFSVAIQTDAYKNLINNTLNDPKRASKFIAAVSSAVATNPALQECDAGSILSSALLGEALNLSPSPQLGMYFLVPYNNKNTGGKVAQFQIGYKGYLQLAIRSGYYKKINVLSIKEGELVKYDPLNEEIEVNLIEDDDIREETPTVGYFAMFEYVGSGFRKTLYWSKEKMLRHADKYSMAFSRAAYQNLLEGKIPDNEKWKYSSFWYKDFDGMAYKTMLRQLISKWGIMSVEMENAITQDMGVPVVKDNAIVGVDYVDTTPDVIEQAKDITPPQEEIPEVDFPVKATKGARVSKAVEKDEPQEADDPLLG